MQSQIIIILYLTIRHLLLSNNIQFATCHHLHYMHETIATAIGKINYQVGVLLFDECEQCVLAFVQSSLVKLAVASAV